MSQEGGYHSLPVPDRADHLWRYTPWNRIHPTGKTEEIPSDVSPALLAMSLLDGSETPEGISLEVSEADSRSTTDVATAFIRELCDGESVCLKVRNGTILEQPLLLTIESNGEVAGLHLTLDIGANCEFEFVTIVQGSGGWFGFLRDGVVGANCNLNDVVVNKTSENTNLLRVDAIRLENDAQTKFGTVGAGGIRTKADLRYELAGRGCSAEVNGSILSADKQHNDHHVELLHQAKESYSRLLWHSSCAGKSRTIGTGMLRVAHGAKGADAGQLFHNLLLSEQAEADSIPELEVLENEVVGCGHGTANGPLDEEQSFYLRSRGFDEAQTTGLLIAAFLNATLSQMGSHHLHEWLNELLAGGLSSITGESIADYVS